MPGNTGGDSGLREPVHETTTDSRTGEDEGGDIITPVRFSTGESRRRPVRQRERNSPVKNRMREICTSGSVRGGDGNIPTYSALGGSNRNQVAPESRSVAELLQRGEERQLAGEKCLLQIGQEQPTEETRQGPNRKEEARPAGDPSRAVRRETSARDNAVQMWVMQEILAPRMEYGEEADLGSQMRGIGGDRAKGLRRGAE